MDISAFKLEMIYHQTATLNMKDLHACTVPVDEDECIPILDIATHLVCNDAAQCVEALPHISRMRIQEEPVGVVKTEHGYLVIISSWPSADAAISPDRRTVIPLGNIISQFDCIIPGCPVLIC